MASELPIIGEYLMIFLQGGYGVKQPTITRFFISHVIVLPVFLIGLLVSHFLMIRRQGVKKPF
jgi:quinol-cytochrome oxidoreductase complex cytochrome b subunit